MAKAGDMRPATDAELQLFREHLERDFPFFQLFFLLINRSCRIRNVDLVWSEHGPAGRVGLRSLSLKDALRGSCLRTLTCSREDPAPALCQIINDNGRREAETCALSDRAAADRVGRSGRSEIYDCDFGVVDIAVPVIADKVHIATLFSGQVLRESPSEAGYARILRSVERLDYVDRAALKQAYWNMPVVSREEIDLAVEVLETFAMYLGNACSRIAELARDQQRRVRELQLLTKELAYMALDGGPCERPALRAILRRLGFSRPPNRVLVLELEPNGRPAGPGISADLAMMTAAQAIEGLCAKTEHAVSVHLHHRGICVLIDDRGGRRAGGEFYARRVARQVLQVAAEHAQLEVRVGIGGRKAAGEPLLESYQEARLALASSADPIAIYTRPSTPQEDLSTRTARASTALGELNFEDAWREIAALPLDVERLMRGNPAAQRSAFASALDAISYATARLGVDTAVAQRLHEEATRAIELASNPVELREAYLKHAGRFTAEARDHVLGRGSKRVKIACRMIERAIEQKQAQPKLSISVAAATLGISASHLSRIFRQSTGVSFQRYVIRRRIARAQRLLLEPHYNISQIAELCGFSDASYFARMFRKQLGVSPREYAEHPMPEREVAARETAPGQGPCGWRSARDDRQHHV